MPRNARQYSSSVFYHIVLRGIAHQILFGDGEDYQRFLGTLQRYLKEEPFEIHAYCLMENHIHLLLHTETALERIMKKIAGSYAYYFNEKYDRCGHLFQDRFKSEEIEDERYLIAAVRYIHNNPRKAGICSREEYPWSSIHAYLGEPDFTSTILILDMTGGREGFLQLSASDEEVGFLDISERKRITDQDAMTMMKNVYHIESSLQLQNMNRSEQDALLRTLKEKGLSVRQIERISGINRGIIQRA